MNSQRASVRCGRNHENTRAEKRLWTIAVLLLAGATCGTSGCSSGSGPNSTSSTSSPVIAANAIVFESNRALDGSDSFNLNHTENVWIMNADGSGALPLTKLTANQPQPSPALGLLPKWSRDGSRIIFNSERALDGSDAASPSRIFNIWVMNADGSGQTPLTKLTATGADSANPTWSPGGSKVAFTSSRALNGADAANATSNIWIMNADGSGQTAVTRLTALFANTSAPHWSPDGKKIAFVSQRALDGSDAANNFTSNIWVMNADGSGQVPLTRITATGGNSVAPVWSPDGSKIAFASGRALDGSDAALPIIGAGAFNVWIVNADGSGGTPLTRLTQFDTASSEPSWSPNGNKIAFTSSRALNGSDFPNLTTDVAPTLNIWVMDADGSSQMPLTMLTALSANSNAPAWSSDGSKILFVSGRVLSGVDAGLGPSTNIWVMNADGSGATPLTRLTMPEAISPQQR